MVEFAHAAVSTTRDRSVGAGRTGRPSRTVDSAQRCRAVREVTPAAPETERSVASRMPASEQWELVLAHRERLLRIARRRLPTVEDAEDCVHEALIRAASAADLDPARVGQFVTSVLVRLCVDHARAASTAQRALGRLVEAHGDVSPEEAICDHAQASWIMENLMGRLSTREREVLRARADGLSTREAARRLNISGKSAEAALTRARSRLRALAA
jgi:RNA polymerase sigma factor (sigma-70 family)